LDLNAIERTYTVTKMQASPNGSALAFIGQALDGGVEPHNQGLYVSSPVGSPPVVLYDHPGWKPDDIRWSPRGTAILVRDSDSKGEFRLITSNLNLGTRLSAAQDRDTGALVFTGTAADANFLDYEIDVRPQSGGASVVAARGTTVVVDALL